jgi:hypothetical protein
MKQNSKLEGMNQINNGTQMKQEKVNYSKKVIQSLTFNNNQSHIPAHNLTMFMMYHKIITLSIQIKLHLKKLRLMILRLNSLHRLFDFTFYQCLTKILEQKRQGRAQQFIMNLNFLSN